MEAGVHKHSWLRMAMTGFLKMAHVPAFDNGCGAYWRAEARRLVREAVYVRAFCTLRWFDVVSL